MEDSITGVLNCIVEEELHVVLCRPSYSYQPGPPVPQYPSQAYSKGEGQYADAQPTNDPYNPHQNDQVVGVPANVQYPYPGPASSQPYSENAHTAIGSKV